MDNTYFIRLTFSVGLPKLSGPDLKIQGKMFSKCVLKVGLGIPINFLVRNMGVRQQTLSFNLRKLQHSDYKHSR